MKNGLCESSRKCNTTASACFESTCVCKEVHSNIFACLVTNTAATHVGHEDYVIVDTIMLNIRGKTDFRRKVRPVWYSDVCICHTRVLMCHTILVKVKVH
jgi:hypothetical protein